MAGKYWWFVIKTIWVLLFVRFLLDFDEVRAYMKPMVAVVMSVYQSDDPMQLGLALDSILRQTYENISVYLYVDGPIGDGLWSCIKDFERLDRRLHVVEGGVNKGLAFALNNLIEIVLSKGCYKYIARMDSDDISRLKRIECQVEFMEKNPDIGVSGAACREFGASFALSEKRLPLTHEELSDFSIARCPFIHPTVIFRSSVFRGGLRYPENYRLTEDMALWFALLGQRVRFANVSEILLDYRLQEGTLARRQGFGKAVAEVGLRLKYMFLLKSVSVRNIILISLKFAFHISPLWALRWVYKKYR